ncbi:hypothetical protein LEP1GSC202_2027 [Leptospira yanagawae serovar Saopaulo str. Sao Paulo = ATCC 700523]|uniref:Uncharacterized protein n=1 Tax=Leptospira yanagawae serovar Saopaulo str. Sao Paulo = ATCC 700523 TaxID=1249483 RepID=A0A5E8HAW3_9LEPT|nr:hypothetical protein LEP1GSC202_2027 [Leptospira yanagawae serovar Saopaulo str. Sao Paulo = ATCC 700523]
MMKGTIPLANVPRMPSFIGKANQMNFKESLALFKKTPRY